MATNEKFPMYYCNTTAGRGPAFSSREEAVRETERELRDGDEILGEIEGEPVEIMVTPEQAENAPEWDGF